MSSTVAPFRPCKTQPVSLLLLIVLPEPRLAGFSVLFVVETMLATAWHRTPRLPMSATQSAPRDGCIAPGGFAAARPSKGQGYFRTSFIRLTSLSRGFGSIGRPPEHRTVHPHAMHDNGQFSGDGNLRLLQAVSFGEPKAPRLERGPFLAAALQRASGLEEGALACQPCRDRSARAPRAT